MPPPNSCPDDDELWIAAVDEGPDVAVSVHLRRCPSCRTRVDALRATTNTLRSLADTVPIPRTAESPAIELDLAQTPFLSSEMESHIGRYPVLDQVSSGGQANVFRGLHPTLGQEVIIKLAHRPASGAWRAIGGLEREAHILATIKHPCLARVIDFDLHDQRPFLVLEDTGGVPLTEFHERSPLSPVEIANVVCSLALGLGAAHEAGVLHLDLKPENVVMTAAGLPQLIDFGTSVLLASAGSATGAATLMGTPEYMAPEQHAGDMHQISPRTDVYGLGGILYYLLHGEPPHECVTGLWRRRPRLVPGDALPSMGARGLPGSRAAAPASDAGAAAVRSQLERIAEHALARHPDQRYAAAADIATELQALLSPAPRKAARMLAVAAILTSCLGLGAWLSCADVVRGPAEVAFDLQLQVMDGDRTVSVQEAFPLRNQHALQVVVTSPVPEQTHLYFHLPDRGTAPCRPLERGGPGGRQLAFPGGHRGLPLYRLPKLSLFVAGSRRNAEPPLTAQLDRQLSAVELSLPDAVLAAACSSRRPAEWLSTIGPISDERLLRRDLMACLAPVERVLDDTFDDYAAVIFRSQWDRLEGDIPAAD